jgi:hypothetical protein
MEKRNEKQRASKTDEYFGAEAADKLRGNLKKHKLQSPTTGSTFATSSSSSSSSSSGVLPKAEASTAAEAPTTRETFKADAIWLCFPCLQKGGEKSARVHNDADKRNCENCRACSEDIFKLKSSLTSSSLLASTPQSSASETSSSSSRSTDETDTSYACVWRLRFDVRTALESHQCHDLQREVGCHKCDKVGCWTQSRCCAFFEQPRPHVANAPTTGREAENMLDRTPVKIIRQAGRHNRVLVEVSGHGFAKGFASGKDFIVWFTQSWAALMTTVFYAQQTPHGSGRTYDVDSLRDRIM